jgi:signal transduction histidine kinase
MVHTPTRELAAAWLTPEPHYLLGVGIALAIAFGLLAHQLRMSVFQSRALAAGNRSLQAGNRSLEAGAEELRELTEVLEARVAERTAELEAFNHSISHDLRSPLGAILNFAAILESEYRDRLDANGLDMLERIRKSAVRGSELLEGLLRLSSAGRGTLVKAELDMNALARESFAQARVSELDADAEFVLEPLPNARGDRTLIGEVLFNLFENALKYSRGCEKRCVTVRGRLENGQCVYEVSDNGCGFDMKYADKLFGLFERIHSSRDGPEGTGVGLALVARIVQRHGGRVSAEGKVDSGARLTFTLPPGRAAT